MAGWQREVEYAWCAAPVVALLWAVPTLEEISQGDLLWLRPVLASPQEAGRRYQDLVLSEAGLREGRWWTLFTHAFLHKDFDHLMGNAQSFVVNGLGVFLDWGAPGLYGLFFAGAGASALNRWGRERQTCAQLEGTIPRAPERVGFIAVPDTAREWWDGVRRGAATRISPTMSSRTESFGASGGACGLMGYGLASSLVWLWRRAASQRALLADEVIPIDAIAPLLTFLQCGYFLLNEWQAARGDRGLTGVDHTGHLTGFAVGAAFGAATAVLRWARRGGGDGGGDAAPPRPRDGGEGLGSGYGAAYGQRRRYISARGDIVD